MPNNRVEEFVQQVRSKLNKNLFLTVLIWAATLGACAIVLVGLAYLVQGYAVPKIFYLLVAICSLLAAGGVWFVRQFTDAQASQFADEHFGLKDSVTSCRNFADDGQEGGYFDLQAKQTDTHVEKLSSIEIPFKFPRKTLAVGLVFGAAAAVMAFIGPSQAVKDRMALEIATAERTADLNKQLEELVEELEEDIQDEEERELVEPEKLREWVKELHETKDRKEALRQYAKLEQKLQKASARLEQKRDEQYLERAAKELDKGENTKELAAKLEQKKYEEAARELDKMKPDDSKKLSEQRKQLAKLRAAAKRMTAAKQKSQKSSKPRKSVSDALKKKSQANNSKNLAKSSKNQDAKASNGKQADAGKGSDSEASASEESVEELVEDLDEALEELDEQLADAEMAEMDGELDDAMLKECKACLGEGEKALGKLGKKLGKMGLKKKLQSKLAKLCKACSQCQSDCAGLCESPNAGGKQAGWGASDSKRDQRDELVDNDQYTKLKGQKGSGPSIVTTEAAEDGSGVTSAGRTEVTRSFQRQMESFVEREDVPDDVKSGVRNYFEMIHKSE